jgi:penicillin G amidase
MDKIIDLMRNWDGTLSADSPAAALHEVLIRQVLGLIVKGKLGKYAPSYRGKSPITGLWGSHSWERLVKQLEDPDSSWFDLGSGENRNEILKQALRRSIDILKKDLGPDPHAWAWGIIHKLTFNHALARQPVLNRTFNRGPYPIGGDGTTIWATTSSDYDLSNASIIGPPFRFIADLGDLDHTLGLLAPGQSGHPGSPHYDDGIKDWFEAGYHVMLFNRKEIEQATKEKLTLKP